MEDQSKAVAVRDSSVVSWTEDEVQLIRDTVAKGATPQEFKLFLYRCKNMQLDPLKPGLIHFVKYGNNPGTIIVGIDGFRVRALRTGRHAGTKRGVIRSDKGHCTGAWAEVYRTDWQQPAREEVSLAEYNTGRANWQKMPETMIKKVAEAAALRMAFPDELGGVYTKEEMDQAEAEVVEVKSETKAVAAATEITKGDFAVLTELQKERGWSGKKVTDQMFKLFAKPKLSELTRDQFEELCDYIDKHQVERSPEEKAADAVDLGAKPNPAANGKGTEAHP